MRVTERNRFESPRRRLETLRRQMTDASAEVTSGLRVRKPSDDPLAAKKVRDVEARLARQRAYQSAIDQADARLRQSDSVLAEATDVVRRIKELGLQAANATANDQDTGDLTAEIQQLTEQLRALANTRHDEGYLFGGFTAGPPVDDQFDVVGDGNVPELEIAEGERVPSGLSAPRVFGDANGGVDVFDAIEALQTALTAGVQADIQAGLDGLDPAVEQIIDARNEGGILLARVEGAQVVADRLAELLPQQRAELVEADFVEAVNELTRAETMFETSLAVAGRSVSGMTILEYL